MYKHIRSNIANHDTLTLSIILFLSALAVRIFIFFLGPVVSNDALFYVTIAKSILSGGTEHTNSFSFFSIYPFIIAFTYKIIPDWEIAGKTVSILGGSLAVVPLYILFSGLLDKRVALIAGFLYVFGPKLAEYSTDILRESTFWLFSFTSLCFAWKGIQGKRVFYAGLAALCAALSFMTRIEGIAIFPIIIFWLSFAIYSKEISFKKGIQFLAAFVLIIPALLLLKITFVDQSALSWIIEKFVEKGRYLLEGEAVRGQEVISAEMFKGLPLGLQLLNEMAEKYRYLIFSTEIVFKTFKSMTAIPVIFLIVGFFLRKTVPFNRREIYLIIWAGVFFIVSIYYMKGTSYFSTRHGLLLGIPALAFSGIGFLELKARLSSLILKLKYSPKTVKLITVTFTCVILAALFVQSITSLRKEKMDLKITGIELKQKGFGGSVMLVQSNLQRLAFYADSDYFIMQEKLSLDSLVNVMKTNKINILVVDLNTVNRVMVDFDKVINSGQFDCINIKRKHKERPYSLVILKLKENQ